MFNLGAMSVSPLLSLCLPNATPGPHKAIGYAHVCAAPSIPHTSASPTLAGQPLFDLQQVGYAVYYPASPGKASWWGGEGRLGWLPEPVGAVVTGYERFLGKKGLKWLFRGLQVGVGYMKFPAYLNAPLVPPPSEKYPVVIFSHGLAGTRNTYSQYCSAIASQGYVVLAIEHRDGSGPAVVLKPERHGEERILSYVKYPDLEWGGESKPSLEGFRTLQLDFRLRETYETYLSFRDLLGSGEREASVAGLDEEKKVEWLQSFRDAVDLDDLSLSGHSFGGGAVLQVVQTPPPDGYTPLPCKRAIALDPWLEPIPVPTAAWNPQSLPPILVINAPGFTEWGTHFRRLLKLCQAEEADASLLTVLGGSHQSFSDFPLFNPTGPGTALALLTVIHDISHAFLQDRLAESPLVSGKVADGGEFQRGKDGHIEGKRGEVVVHVLAGSGGGKGANGNGNKDEHEHEHEHESGD